jgi:hypothetical protein
MTMADTRKSRAAALERDLEDTRQRIDVTLSELIERLSPGELLDQGLQYLRRGTAGPGRFAANLGHAVQANPLPIALIGLGVAWLAVGEKPARYAAALSEGAQESGLKEKVEGVKEKVEGVVESAQQTVSAVGERIRDVGGRAQEATHRIGERAASARSQWQHLIDEQPLLLGLAGLAIGAVLGGSLPPTESEDKLLGQPRDELLQRGAEKASQGAEAARSRIEHAAEDEPGRADEDRRRRGDGAEEVHAPI